MATSEGLTLAQKWMKLQGLAERGAAGRLVIAPSVLTRADLDTNYDVVALAILHYGTRPTVDILQEDAIDFFSLSRPRGLKPVSSILVKCFVQCVVCVSMNCLQAEL